MGMRIIAIIQINQIVINQSTRYLTEDDVWMKNARVLVLTDTDRRRVKRRMMTKHKSITWVTCFDCGIEQIKEGNEVDK